MSDKCKCGYPLSRHEIRDGICSGFTPADSPDAERVGEQGPFLPCPICRGVEGCDHAIPERRRAYLQLSSRLAEAEEILKSAKSVIAGHGCRMNHEGCSRCYLRWEIHEYEKQHGELDMSGYKYPKGENL